MESRTSPACDKPSPTVRDGGLFCARQELPLPPAPSQFQVPSCLYFHNIYTLNAIFLKNLA